MNYQQPPREELWPEDAKCCVQNPDGFWVFGTGLSPTHEEESGGWVFREGTGVWLLHPRLPGPEPDKDMWMGSLILRSTLDRAEDGPMDGLVGALDGGESPPETPYPESQYIRVSRTMNALKNAELREHLDNLMDAIDLDLAEDGKSNDPFADLEECGNVDENSATDNPSYVTDDPGHHYRCNLLVAVDDDDADLGFTIINLDPYRIARTYSIGGGPREHILEKVLRGTSKGGSETQLVSEIQACLNRWREMLSEGVE